MYSKPHPSTSHYTDSWLVGYVKQMYVYYMYGSASEESCIRAMKKSMKKIRRGWREFCETYGYEELKPLWKETFSDEIMELI